ncbi:hypothetical protein DFQ26_005661 [Actinomortierella ambigua]|nr:hypothetical protein DFQ26_005661 [Actinomortierella ambigua]
MPLLSQIPITTQQQQQMLRARLMNRHRSPKEEDSATKALARASATIEPLDEESGEVMNVLVSGDDHGNLRLGIFGAFDLPVISLTGLVGTIAPFFADKTMKVVHANVLYDLSEMTALCVCGDNFATEDSLADQTQSPGKLVQLTVNLGLFHHYRKEVRSISLKKRPVLHLLNYLKGSLAAMESEYKRVQRYSEECIETIEQNLSDNGDILGFSQWKERFSALSIKEQDVYNCIKAVGDFMGILEDLFRCVKEQQAQFLEFKNWLDQVLDMMQNASRSGDDVTPEEQKRFPPVNTIKVAEYINSGLISDPVQKFFQRNEDDSPPPDKKSRPDNAQLAPQYPVVYSFASGMIRPETKAPNPKYRVPDIESEDEVSTKLPQGIPAKTQGTGLQRAKTMVLSKGPSPLARSATKSFLKQSSATPSSNNPFKRTLTTMPPPPAPRVPRATATPTAQDTQPSVRLGSTPIAGATPSTPSTFTLGEQLQIMMERCTSLFRVSEKAVVDSIGIEQPIVIKDLDSKHLEAASKESKRSPKVATRYCDIGQEAWYYTAIYHEPTTSFPDGTVCILRKRHVAPKSASFMSHVSLPSLKGELSSGTASRKHKLDVGTQGPFKRTMSSRNSSSSGSGSSTPGLTNRRTAQSPLTPLAPGIERLSLRSTALAAPHPPSNSRSSSDEPSKTAYFSDTPDMQVLVYSLRDDAMRGSEGHPGKSTTPGSSSSSSSSSYVVRDMLFMDDHTLGLLLSSNRLQQQYVVSVPIPIDNNDNQDDLGHGDDDQAAEGRQPRFTTLDESMFQSALQGHTPLLDMILSSCVQDSSATSNSSMSSSSSSSSAPSPHSGRLGGKIVAFPLPITRSRCVTHFGGGEVGAVGVGVPQDSGGGGAGGGGGRVTGLSHGAIQPPDVLSEAAPVVQGPMALASNEREHRRVLSVHGAAENIVVGGGDGSGSRVDGGGYPRAAPTSIIGRRIAVFELDGEYYHPS